MWPRLPAILGAPGDGYLEFDRALRVLRPASLAGRNLWAHWRQAAGSGVEAALRQALATGEPVTMTLGAPSGTRRVEWRACPNAAGGLSIFARDLPGAKEARLGVLAALDEGFLLAEIQGDPAAPIEDLHFLEANPAATQVTGEDYTGRTLVDIDPALAPCWRDIFGRAPPDGTGQRFELHVAPLRAWLECYVVRLGTPPSRRVAALFRDVSDRRRAQAALAESGQRMAAIVAQAAVGLCEISLDGRFLQVNEELCRILGRDAATLTGLGVGDVTWPEDMPRSQLALHEVIETGQPVAVEKRYRRPDGSPVWTSSSLSRLDDEAGRPRAVLAVTADLTVRKQNEAHLYESEARVRTLAEGIPQMVWRADGVGLLDWVSPQWTAFTGLSMEASLGRGWLNAVHPEDRAATQDAWTVAAEAEGCFAVEHRLHVVTEGYRWCQSRAVLRLNNGTVEWLGTSTDIEDQVRLRQDLARARDEMESLVAARTSELANALEALRAEVQERERAEEALRHTQKLEAVGQLTGGIAHDFNNMLQGVTGGLDMARRRIEQGRGADAARYLDAAQDAAQRAAALTRRLLAFARRQRLDPRLLDPAALVAGMGDLIRRTMGPSIEVELQLEDASSSVLCDPSELEGALLNLCINARDAMTESGRLLIGTTTRRFARADLVHHAGAEPGIYVGISVSDTGSGIRREVIERVFEPFFTTKPQGQGTGLGLSQVYGFVRQSGGLVRIESTPGRGTTVRLWLPRHDTPAALPAAPEVHAIPTRCASGEVVLLVDDEAAVRAPAAARLRELGYEVLEAPDGAAALRLVSARQRIDLLVTDVGLTGGMNGRQLAEVLKDQRPKLPILFITGYAGAVLPQGVDVIGKPFDLDVLAQRVQAALARR